MREARNYAGVQNSRVMEHRPGMNPVRPSTSQVRTNNSHLVQSHKKVKKQPKTYTMKQIITFSVCIIAVLALAFMMCKAFNNDVNESECIAEMYNTRTRNMND